MSSDMLSRSPGQHSVFEQTIFPYPFLDRQSSNRYISPCLQNPNHFAKVEAMLHDQASVERVIPVLLRGRFHCDIERSAACLQGTLHTI